jgi:peptidoglycan/LPS O-acetylase OafA/YrhL
MVSAVLKGSAANHARRYWSLDILRGICSLTVFLNHWVLWSNFPPVGALESTVHRWFGYLCETFTALAWPTGGQHPAVLCFFVLSGFCIHTPFERRLGQPTHTVDWRGYFSRRTWRIVPVYWTGALLGLFVVFCVRWHPVGDPLLLLHTAITPGQIAARMGGYSGLWPEEIFAGNYILGTVAVEILIYLLYPFFFIGVAAGRWTLLGTIVVGLQLLALALQPYVNPFVLFPGVLVMALFWYLGALAAHWRQARCWTVRGWWLGGIWGLFLALKMLPHFYGLNLLRQAVWGVLCMGLLMWLLDWEMRNEACRNQAWSRLLRWFGRISYPLYAVHTPVILIVNWTMLTLVRSHDYAWQLIFNLVLCLAVSTAVHYGIERRFYRQRGYVPAPVT